MALPLWAVGLFALWPLIGKLLMLWVDRLGRDCEYQLVGRAEGLFEVMMQMYLWPVVVARAWARYKQHCCGRAL